MRRGDAGVSADRAVDEILDTYRHRPIDGGLPYSPLSNVNLDRIHERERVLAAALRRRGIGTLGDLRILDVGCGPGGELMRLAALGADPRLLHGIDLRPDAIQLARDRLASGFTVGDARSLPFEAGTFDLVTQFTALSSMPTAAMRLAVAQEMIRVAKPGGIVVSYDFIWNPTNRDTVGIPAKELRRIFSPLRIELHRVTLAPPIDRRTRRVPGLRGLLKRVPFLRSHVMAIIDIPMDRPVSR